MAKKNITTIEGLAELINETMASKEDLKEVKQDITALRSEMQTGFERIANLLLEGQRRKIENLGTRMKNSRTPSPSSGREHQLSPRPHQQETQKVGQMCHDRW